MMMGRIGDTTLMKYYKYQRRAGYFEAVWSVYRSRENPTYSELSRGIKCGEISPEGVTSDRFPDFKRCGQRKKAGQETKVDFVS